MLDSFFTITLFFSISCEFSLFLSAPHFAQWFKHWKTTAKFILLSNNFYLQIHFGSAPWFYGGLCFDITNWVSPFLFFK